MIYSFCNCVLTNRNKMPTNLANKALLKIKSAQFNSKTSIDDRLFQFISQAIKISPFVAEVVTRQCEPVLTELSWHNSHQALSFSDYLHFESVQDLFETDFKYKAGEIPYLSSYRANYQSENSIMKWVRSVRYRHSAAIAVLELNNQISIEESMTRMSILAEELILIAYMWSYATQQEIFGLPGCPSGNKADISNVSNTSTADKVIVSQNMLILAMGKFGGCELNFSSDIDLIFFYSHDGQTKGGRRKIENSRFFQKIGISLVKLLHEPTEDGFVFRVDMRLRPYGASGNLVMSVEQAEDYYHEQGRGWERFAMVRARVLTGRNDEKKLLETIITPFAFRRYIDYGVIDSLRNMKEMIQREVRRRGLKGNIKLGAGGIREIEFMVQSLQLIQGGRDKRLQEKTLLKVLPLLAEAKLLPKEISLELADNYRFLRRLENILQELEEKQTQQLPEDKLIQSNIADLMGFAQWNDFTLVLNNVFLKTNEHFNALFSEEKNQVIQQDDFYLSLWEGHISSDSFQEKLQNFTDENIEKIIDRLDRFRCSASIVNLSAKGAKRLRNFMPALLEICLKVSDPVKTVNSLITVLKAILKRTAYLELLSENLPILQHFVDLVSRSEWIVDRLSNYPILFDELLYPNSLYEPLQTGDLKNELQQIILRIDENDEEQILDAVRRFKQTNELRVAAALLTRQLNISQVSGYLSQLAQVVIQSAFEQSWHSLTSKYGVPEGLMNTGFTEPKHQRTGFSIVAYGKLGGFELGFNSDLDLVFLFDQPLSSHTSFSKNTHKKSINIGRFYTRLAQKIIHFLSTRTSLGLLYEVDMRLRPSGNSGLLVSHIDAFEDYQKESAWIWEHQALVRARAIGGDVELNRKFEQIRYEILDSERNLSKLKHDVVEMREKMRNELDKTTQHKLDLKQCIGGLVDIEFISQYLVLSCFDMTNQSKAFIKDKFIPSNTIEALKYAQQSKRIKEESVDILIDSYRRYRNNLNEMAIVSDDELIDTELFVYQRNKVTDIWDEIFVTITRRFSQNGRE